jgi:DNA-binding SARP family transcriptional activator
MADELRINLFGYPHIVQDNAPVTGFVLAKALAVVAYLAVTGDPHSRDFPAGLLWGEMPSADAKTNLRQVISNLRRLIG